MLNSIGFSVRTLSNRLVKSCVKEVMQTLVMGMPRTESRSAVLAIRNVELNPGSWAHEDFANRSAGRIEGFVPT